MSICILPASRHCAIPRSGDILPCTSSPPESSTALLTDQPPCQSAINMQPGTRDRLAVLVLSAKLRQRCAQAPYLPKSDQPKPGRASFCQTCPGLNLHLKTAAAKAAKAIALHRDPAVCILSGRRQSSQPLTSGIALKLKRQLTLKRTISRNPSCSRRQKLAQAHKSISGQSRRHIQITATAKIASATPWL